MKVLKAAENYLETILVLQQRQSAVRSIDVVNELGHAKPTVSVMMKKLRENGYIKMDQDGFITLTTTGRTIAQKIYERHQVIAQMLIALGVDEKTACSDACKIEHVISEKSFACLKAHYRKNREERPENPAIAKKLGRKE